MKWADTYTRKDSGTGREIYLTDADWPNNGKGNRPMNADFQTKLDSFVAGCQSIIDQHLNSRDYQWSENLSTMAGVRYVRIVRTHVASDGVTTGQRSVHCFVDKTNGDVLKAEGWKKPAKHARGNIYDERNGLAKMGEYGPAYLK